MGLNKKRWLALVLTIIMVLGMGVPTAFAAGTKFAGIRFQDAEGNPITGSVLAMSLNDKDVRINMLVGAGGMGWDNKPLTNDNLAQTPKITFSEVDPAITVAVGGDGYIVVNPVSMTTTNASFKVKIENTTTEPWGLGEVFGNSLIPAEDYFEDQVNFKIAPVITASASEVKLNSDRSKNNWNKNVDLIPNPDNGVISNIVVTATHPGRFAINNFANNKGFSVAVANNANTAEGVFTVNADIDGVAAEPLVIPYIVENTLTAGAPHQVVVDKAALTVKRNTATLPTFKVTVNDSDGKLVASDANLPITYGGSSILIQSDNPSLITANQVTGLDSFRLAFGPAAPEGGKANLTVRLNGALSATVAVTVEPVKISVGTSAVSLDLNRATVASRESHISNLTVATTETNEFGAATVSNVQASVSNSVASQSVSGTKLTLTGLRAGSGTVTINADVDGVPADALVIPYTVVDSTPVPVLTPDVTAFTLDKVGSASKTLAFTASGSYLGTAGNKITALSVTEVDALLGLTGTGTVSLPTPKTDKQNVAIALPNSVKVGSTKLQVSGAIDDVPFKSFTIDVTVKNSTDGVPAAIQLSQTSINQKVNAGNVAITAVVVDHKGVALSPQPTIRPNLVDVTPTGATVIRTSSTASPFTFTPGVAGTATITLTTAGLLPTKIPVTITPLTFSADVTSVNLDLLTAEASKGTITLSSTDGTITDAVMTYKAATPVILASLPTFASNKFDLVGNTVGKNTLVITAKVNGYDAGSIEIPAEVVNTRVLKSNKDLFEFDVKVGAKNTDTLTLTGNPAGEAITAVTVVSSDTELLTATKSTDTSWNLKALKAGEGTLTINGKVGTIAVAPLVVKYKIVDSSLEQSIEVTPTSIELDLSDATKLTQTLTFKGPLTTDTVVITSITPSATGLVEVTGTGLTRTVTAKAVGEGNLTVVGTINGIATKDLVIGFKVINGTVPTTAGLYMDDVLLSTSTSVINRIGYVKYPSVNVTKTVANTHTVVAKDASGNIVPITKVVNGTTSKVSAKVNADGTATVVLKTATGSTSVTFTAGGVDSKVKIGGKTQAIKKINEGAPAITIKVGQRLNVNPSFTPAYASNQRVSYKSNKTSVAKVSNGVLTGVSAGEAKLTITSKAKSSIKSVITVTVSADYSSVNYKSAYLVTDTNANEAAMAAILSASVSGTAAKLPGDSKAALVAALNAYANDATIKDEDVFTLYISGATSGNGLKIGSDVITFDDLAKELAKINGNIFLMMDCNSSSTVFTSKSLSEAETNNALIAAFAKANASIQAKTVTSATGNDRAKFKILTATSAKKQVTSSAKIFSEYLVKALTATDGKIAASGANKVTLTELYNYMVKNANPAAKTAGVSQRVGVYPAGDKFPVYAQAATVTP